MSQTPDLSAASTSVTPSSLELGQTLLGGRLCVTRHLGRGGRGTVYEVRDRRRNRRLAIKTSIGDDARSGLQLEREFRMMRGVSHPNVVCPHQLFTEGRRSYFTMQLATGLDFDCWLGPFAAADRDWRLRHAFSQLVAGVHAIHAMGRVHCDLKPSNVLVSARGQLRILDFGLASEVGVLVCLHPLSGTPAYMAPELLRHLPATPASDAYSVGVMLFEALTGRLPFEGRLHEMLFAKQWFNPPRPCSLRPDAPSDLSALCLRLLARDPAQRPSFDELIAGNARARRSVPREGYLSLGTGELAPLAVG